MRFSIDTDTDVITFADGLQFSLKFIHTHFKSPKGTLVEFLGPTEMGPVTMKTHPVGSLVLQPDEFAETKEPTVAQLMALAAQKR